MSFVSKAVGAITGANDSAKGAQKAADSQVAAIEKSNEYAREANAQNRADAAPYREAGYAANSEMMRRLGLGGGAAGAGAVGGGTAPTALTEQQIRQELQGQYTTSGTPAGAPAFNTLPADVQAMINREGGPTGYAYNPQTGKYGYQYNQTVGGGDNGEGTVPKWYYADQVGGTQGGIDEAGLNAAVQQRLQQQQQAQQAYAAQQQQASQQQSDGTYPSGPGSLLQSYTEFTPFAEQYKGVEYTPYRDYEDFSLAKFQADPGYQFRQTEGNNALLRAAAASGGLNSGRASKDLAEFNSGLASQEYGNAFGRYNTEYTTGRDTHQQNFNTAYGANLQDYQTRYNAHNNDYTTGFNAFNQSQDNTYNRLMGIVGVGTGVNGQIANGNLATGQQLAGNAIQAGNAQAAGQVAAGNAASGGFNNLLNTGLTAAALYSGFGGGAGAAGAKNAAFGGNALGSTSGLYRPF